MSSENMVRDITLFLLYDPSDYSHHNFKGNRSEKINAELATKLKETLLNSEIPPLRTKPTKVNAIAVTCYT